MSLKANFRFLQANILQQPPELFAGICKIACYLYGLDQIIAQKDESQ